MVRLRRILLGILLVFCFVNIEQNVLAQASKTFECRATYYHDMFENRKTSSGEIFSQKKYTAAHKTLPLNTLVKVTNLSNGRSVLVKVNDRCPKKGVIDLSYIAAKQILLHKTGTARVRVEVMEDEYFEIFDEQELLFEVLDKLKADDKIRNHQFDSLLYSRKNKYEEIFAFNFYVRICSVEKEEDSELIQQQLPENLKNKVLMEKVLNAGYYNVNIGPFLSIKLAEDALNELKNTYKSAYIVKKKEK